MTVTTQMGSTQGPELGRYKRRRFGLRWMAAIKAYVRILSKRLRGKADRNSIRSMTLIKGAIVIDRI
ncbi:hypothetical protein J6590_007866 [Homalodisca vitripennis]|nr:hypothetical protein J6590_007866 [Homalodisca vitripennis]